MKVLHVSNRVPVPANDGGAIAILNMLNGLVENKCEIDFISINTPKSINTSGKIASLNNHFDIFVDTRISPFKALKSLLFKNTPYNVERFYNKAIEALISKQIQSNKYDFILLESAFTCLYIPIIQKLCSTPILVRTHNVEYMIWKRLAANESNPLKKWYLKHLSKRLALFEADFYQRADGIVAISKDDKNLLLKMGISKPIEVVPTGISLKNKEVSTDTSGKKNTIFSLSSLDWMPNSEGLNWFLKEVWPMVHQANPSIEFHIAGKATPQWVLDLNLKNVIVHGYVDDAQKFQQQYGLMLVPLLSGSGMRVKIIEGFANKKCILSTSIGAEGIPYTKNENIRIADTPKEWAKEITELVANEAEMNRISENAYEFVKQNYDTVQLTSKVIHLVEQIKRK